MKKTSVWVVFLRACARKGRNSGVLISGGDAPDTVAGWCIGGGNTKKEAATHPGLQPPTKNYYGNNLVLCLFKVCFLWQKTI